MMNQYKFCTQCRHKNRFGAKFCTQCGHRFKKVLLKANSQNCPICYTVRRSGSNFCRNCGYEFQATEPPIQQPIAEAIELPPAAVIMPPEDINQSTPNSIVPETSRKTGILITQEELAKLRQAKTEQIIFLPSLRRKKN